jgi:hypothetical protein
VDRGDRAGLIKRLARSLSVDSWANMAFTLRQFDVSTDVIDGWQNYYEFALLALEQARDDQLIELQRHVLPDDASLALTASLNDGPWEAGAFRLFVSHTNANRQRAGGLRRVLGGWGVDAFVAHDTIEPTREWQDVIEAALMTCDALCALVTEDFVQSRWCDQEVGFAVARGILVVPLKVGADPHGFIGKYQALTIQEATSVLDVAGKLFEALAKGPTTALAMAPAIVRRYEKSGSFDNTRAAFALMRAIPGPAWTPAMMEQVERAAAENTQVQHANLPGGRPIPEAAAELLRELRGEPDVQPRPPADDDIPF